MAYDRIAHDLFHSHTPPYPNIKADLIQFSDENGKPLDAYCVRMYQDNLAEFSGPQQSSIAEWLKEVLSSMNKLPNMRLVWDLHE